MGEKSGLVKFFEEEINESIVEMKKCIDREAEIAYSGDGEWGAAAIVNATPELTECGEVVQEKAAKIDGLLKGIVKHGLKDEMSPFESGVMFQLVTMAQQRDKAYTRANQIVFRYGKQRQEQ